MTLPDERYRAVLWARNFLFDLCDTKKTPGIPRAIRQQAQSILRHYPNDYDMNKTCQTSPDIFQERMEAVTRLMAVYEQRQKEISKDES